MSCHAAIHIRGYVASYKTVTGKCDCGIRTGDLVYSLASERAGTIEAAGVILKLLHQERPANERISSLSCKD
jgi:hypothetical protein